MTKKLPQLDGLRGIAIILVILHNQTPKYPSLHLEGIFKNGWMGVDLFFVLSGFLITGILMDTRRSAGYFKNFYARRCLRIWPLYYSVLLLVFVAIPMVRPSEAAHIFDHRSAPWWAYPLFLQNFLVAIPTHAMGPLGVSWSLAIEEQFYLAWPLVVRYASARQVRLTALAVVCLSPVLRIVLASHDVILYSNLFSRLDGLMAGAFLASMTRLEGFQASRFVRIAWAVLITTLPLAFVVESAHIEWLVFTLTSVSGASLVYLALFSGERWLQQALANRFIVYTGTISYGLYLLHKLPFDLAQAFHLEKHELLVFSGGLVASYAIAALSWSLLEEPFLRLKRYFEPVDIC